MRAAALKGKGEWTVEAAIPLATMAGVGKLPTEWIANVNRARYAGGQTEESAWSPTFSGDSHVPERFGRLLFAELPAEEKPADKPVVRTEAMEILPCQGGEAVVRFDLSSLPKGAKVYRADLWIFCKVQVDGQLDEALADIEIYPQFASFAAGGTPKVPGKRVELRAPWYDRFDVTEAVQQWAAGRDNGGFFVKACPFWNPKATCLDVAYEGRSENPPPQATEVKAFHRNGQTFITWKEIADPVGRDEITWGALKLILEDLDRKGRLSYCVYRSDKPISAASLPEAELITAVKPLSCWNINGRNIERPIDLVIATKDVLVTGQWNPFRDATPDGDYGRDCPVDRLVIRDDDPPLPRATGLYVHTATTKTKVYYAVVTCLDGVQNTADISDRNSLVAPVDESPAEPEPVFQRELPKMPMFNYPDKRPHYVTWLAPPYVNLPSQYYNWTMAVPENLGKGVPLELSLHRDGHSYWRTQYHVERDSIVLCPHDFPLKTWWYGYHESCGTLRSLKQGAVQPYTERRLLAFVEWAAKNWPVDRNRILVTGCRGGASGSGALHLALRYPEVFNLVVSGHGLVDYADAARTMKSRGEAWMGQSMHAVWGKVEWGLKTDAGKNVWDEHDLVKLVAARPPAADLPFVTLTSSERYAACREFYKLMLEQGRPIIADFEWGGARLIPVSATAMAPNAVRLDVRKNRSMLGFRHGEALSFLTKGSMGHFNRALLWRSEDLVDEPDRYEVTVLGQCKDSAVDVTVRRLQHFTIQAGQTYSWTNASLDGKAALQQGEAAVGNDGLLTVKGFKVLPAGSRLTIRRQER